MCTHPASLPFDSDIEKLRARIRELEAENARLLQLKQTARVNEERYRALFEQSHDAVFILSIEGVHLDANRRASELLGYTREELLSLSVVDTSAEQAESKNVIERLLNGEHIPLYERRFRRKNGEIIFTEVNVEVVRDVNGSPLHIQSVVRDITERKRAEQALRESELRYRIVTNNTHDWAFWQSPEGRFIYSSPSCQRVTGYEAAEFLHDSDLLLRIIHPDDLAVFVAHHARVVESKSSGGCEFRIVSPDNTVRWIEHVCQPVFDEVGQYLGTRGNNRDVTERKYAELDLAAANEQMRMQVREIMQLQSELREQALRDPLTDLYNRRYLGETLERELARVEREQKPLSVIMFDIDHFKNVNDTHGHIMGDQFLVEIASILKNHSRASDIACRYGGEEFLLVLPGVTAKAALARAEEIRRQCESLNLCRENIEVGITISMGVAAYPDHEKDARGLIEKADHSMYASKARGRNQITIWNAGL